MNKNVKIKHITIVKVKCLIYIIEIIRDELLKMGWKCDIIDKKDVNYYISLNNPLHYFLFLWPLDIDNNTIKYKRYILYQLEQNINNQLSINYRQLHETQKLKRIYDNASLLIDYCKLNINVLNQYYSNTFKQMNIPARYINTNDTDDTYEYDIIFIGLINDKRNNILNQLREKYKVLIVDNTFGKELKKMCKKAHICLNIHFYENAILERVRLNEILEYDIKIISEKPCQEDIEICNYYKSIHFIEMITNSYNELFETIDRIKSEHDNIDTNTTNTVTESKNALDLKDLECIFKEDIQSLFAF
jgi:hypothetical protein